MRRVVAICMMMSLSMADAGMAKTARNGRSGGNEPFRTFGLLDSKLGALNKQQEELKQVLNPEASSKATSTKPKSRTHAWSKPAREAEQSAKSIAMLAGRQRRRYGTLKEPFGVHAFGKLSSRADDVSRAAAHLQRAMDQQVAGKLYENFDQRMLALVLQYQALAGGYGALRCSAGQQPCCVEKDSVTKDTDSPIACRWVCGSNANSCRKGFTGPRISRRR